MNREQTFIIGARTVTEFQLAILADFFSTLLIFATGFVVSRSLLAAFDKSAAVQLCRRVGRWGHRLSAYRPDRRGGHSEWM